MGKLNIRVLLVVTIVLFLFELFMSYFNRENMLYYRFQNFLWLEGYNNLTTNLTIELIKTENMVKTEKTMDASTKFDLQKIADQITSKSMNLDNSNVTTNLYTLESTSRNCNFVTWDFNPSMGLGNRMFVYAALYGLAKYNNKIPYIPNFDYDLDKIFQVSIRPHKLEPSPSFTTRGENGCCRFDVGSIKLECSRNVALSGYRQSYRYFEKYIEDVKKEFAFSKSVEQTCLSWHKNISITYNCSSVDCILVGAHMRRGDFTYAHKQQFGHSPATEIYLQKAVKFFDDVLANKFKTIIYVILGNDFEWNFQSSRNISGNPIVVLKPDTPGVDMCILAKCNHTIISAGSFGWWAAFLAGGNATYMKNQCRPGSSLCNEFEMNDYINPQWKWTVL